MTTDPQSFYFGIYQPACGQHHSGEGWRGCNVCNIKFPKMELTRHVTAPNHKKKVSECARPCVSLTLARRTRIVALESRLTELEHTKWQFHVKALLFDYLWEGDVTIFNKAENLLKLYEHMGRLSLLELAVWKAASISQVEIDSKTSMKTLHDVILCAAEYQHTWKKRRTETRKSNAIEIIVKHVLPFLGKP
jgi:hypothetical protein